MIRLWEEARIPLLALRYLVWAPILWALDHIRPEPRKDADG